MWMQNQSGDLFSLNINRNSEMLSLIYVTSAIIYTLFTITVLHKSYFKTQGIYTVIIRYCKDSKGQHALDYNKML